MAQEEDEPKRDDDDEDQRAILARRSALVASAIAGLALSVGDGCDRNPFVATPAAQEQPDVHLTPLPCLTPIMTTPGPVAYPPTPTPPPMPCLAPPPVSPYPVTCLSVSPHPCLRPTPTPTRPPAPAPQPCLRRAAPSVCLFLKHTDDTVELSEADAPTTTTDKPPHEGDT